MNIMTGTLNLRWDPYFMRRGNEFSDFWKDYLKNDNRNLLYVLGQGFDPRMCIGIGNILNAGGSGVRDCLLIQFDEGPHSPSIRYAPLVSNNLTILKESLQGRGNLLTKSVRMWSDDGPGRRRIGSRSAADIFSSILDFETYTDIVIDISAMPLSIYFSLIGKTLHLLDSTNENISGRPNLNIHVVVCEDAKLDDRIRNVGIDDTASYVHGFSGDLEMEATEGIPKVWIPILGEGQRNQLERIYILVNPDEICPVLPFPSLSPRRGDELLIEYRELLFDHWRIEPRNIIYSSERNPFETYRQIQRAVLHYNQALESLGGCKAAVSAVSSKLLSLGAFLATYELKSTGISIGLAHIEAQGYEVVGGDNTDSMPVEGELFTLCLAGECYEL